MMPRVPPRGIIVNTRVASGALTGVQRYLNEILRRFPPEYATCAPRRRSTGAAGHLWEQTILPARIGADLLWSPSNTGPLAVARQVVTIHDAATLDHPEWQSRKFAAWYRFLLPKLAQRAGHVIAVSQFTKDRLVATCNIPGDKITVILNGVDEKFHPRPPADISAGIASLNLPSPHYLLTVGSLEPRKNLRNLLQAWAQAQAALPEHLWLVVTGGKGRADVFAAATGVETLPPRVHLTGHVGDDVLTALYAGASAFAYVAQYEGFGLPPLEAMASGVPVLVSNAPALAEVVGEAGLAADAFDVAGIAAGITRLLTHRTLAQDLASRGLARAGRFSWDKAAAATWSVLQETAKV